MAAGSRATLDSTIKNSRTNDFYGGGAFFNFGDLYLINATLVGNGDPSPAIYNTAFGYLSLSKTLVFSGSGGSIENCAGEPIDFSNFSLFHDFSCSWLAGTSNREIPGLEVGYLTDNGGPSWTNMIPANSPAVDGGKCALTEDQRGVALPQGPACDIGSVERRLDEGAPKLLFMPLLRK